MPLNVELKTADALGLPYSDCCFDAVSAFSVLHHTENHFWLFQNILRALQEIARVLKPHGMFVYEEYVHRGKIRNLLSQMDFKIVYRTTFLVLRRDGSWQSRMRKARNMSPQNRKECSVP